MLSFVTTQAIVLSKAMQRSTAQKDAGSKHTPRARTALFRRFFDAIFQGRMRRAEIEVEHHRQRYEGHTR
jgi:hypothetical protein